jgi:hypothetical protein
MSDLDLDISSVSELSSYADARADTPTMGNEDRSDSEVTILESIHISGNRHIPIIIWA